MHYHPLHRSQRTNPHRIPTIKISLDELIKSSYHTLSKEPTSILQSQVPNSNGIMLQYIKSIYDIYSLPDPLEETLVKSRRRNKLSVSEEKIMLMKREMKNCTPSKEKVISSTASIKKRIMNSSTNHKNYRTAEISSFNIDYPNESTHSKSYFQQKSNRYSLNPGTLEVQPIFRYCFMCQQPILESNIMIHEAQCPEFKKLYAISSEEISYLLMEKISRLKSQITNLVSESSTLIKEDQERKIKLSVKEWLLNIDQNIDQLDFGLKYKRLYDNVVENINNSTYLLLDLTKKLKWFIRIREQLRAKFNI